MFDLTPQKIPSLVAKQHSRKNHVAITRNGNYESRTWCVMAKKGANLTNCKIIIVICFTLLIADKEKWDQCPWHLEAFLFVSNRLSFTSVKRLISVLSLLKYAIGNNGPSSCEGNGYGMGLVQHPCPWCRLGIKRLYEGEEEEASEVEEK